MFLAVALPSRLPLPPPVIQGPNSGPGMDSESESLFRADPQRVGVIPHQDGVQPTHRKEL